MWNFMNDHMAGYGWGGWMMMGGLHMIALLVFIGLLVWLVIRSSRGDYAGGRRTALELLDERYARGEIDRDEYQQRRRDLA
jgi:putative membrane protein